LTRKTRWRKSTEHELPLSDQDQSSEEPLGPIHNHVASAMDNLKIASRSESENDADLKKGLTSSRDLNVLPDANQEIKERLASFAHISESVFICAR
jgi:hypothetical protein